MYIDKKAIARDRAILETVLANAINLDLTMAQIEALQRISNHLASVGGRNA
jgi:hypothetical protein